MIQNGKVVTLGYVLKNSKGEELDRADRNDPFVYLHGQGQIVPGLESALMGLDTGAKKQVSLKAADAYGDVNPALRTSVERSMFPADLELQTGAQFRASVGDVPVVFTIKQIEDNKVHIDGNHPLAGESLDFDVEVLEVREATASELEHGHAHGPHGHHDH